MVTFAKRVGALDRGSTHHTAAALRLNAAIGAEVETICI